MTSTIDGWAALLTSLQNLAEPSPAPLPYPSTSEILTDLEGRLTRASEAVADLRDEADKHGNLSEWERLRGKVSGINLALGYVKDAIADLDAQDPLHGAAQVAKATYEKVCQEGNAGPGHLKAWKAAVAAALAEAE